MLSLMCWQEHSGRPELVHTLPYHQAVYMPPSNNPPLSGGCFRSVWTVVYCFWAHLIWVPKLGKLGKKDFVKVNIDISYYISF